MADEVTSALVKAVEILDEAYKVGHEVAQLIPNDSRDNEIYAIAGGSQASIAEQQSLFMANYQLMQNTFGIDPPDFKEWAKAFEYCFPRIVKNNQYIDSPGNGVKPWLTDVANRPRIRVVNVPEQQKKLPAFIYVEFEPERNNPNEVYFLAGTITQVVQHIWQIWNFRQVMKQQNLSMVLGYPLSEAMQRRPHQGVSITFILTNYQTPPFYKRSDRLDFKQVQITVPFVDKAKVSFNALRAACGGNGGLNWGKTRAMAAVCDNPDFYQGSRFMPQVWCAGETYAQAKSNIKNFMLLSSGKIVKISEGKIDDDELLNPLNKPNPPAKVYPAHCFITNGYLVGNNTTVGKQKSLGKFNTKRNKFDLWPSVAPVDFTDRINELFEYSNQTSGS